MNVEQHMLPFLSVSGKMTLNHTHKTRPPAPTLRGRLHRGNNKVELCQKRCVFIPPPTREREKGGGAGIIIISALCRESLYYLQIYIKKENEKNHYRGCFREGRTPEKTRKQKDKKKKGYLSFILKLKIWSL